MEQEQLLDRARPGKYLTFLLGDEVYGVDIRSVQEIIGTTPVTPVPNCPPCMRGIINLRGKIIAVLDLRLKFGMQFRPYDERTCFIVMNAVMRERTVQIGIVVDTVLEVAAFTQEQIEQSPEFSRSVDTSFITGMGKRADNTSQVVILLDINAVIQEHELIQGSIAQGNS